MKERTPSQNRLLACAFLMLAALLSLIMWQGLRRGDAARVGVPRSAQAYGAAMLLQTPSAQFRCVTGSTAGALEAALAAGELDAALIPYEAAREMAGVTIRAVLGDASLLVLSRDEAILSPQDLAGRTLTLPAGLQGSTAESMLKKLLHEAGVPYTPAYGEAGDIYCCDIDAAARLLQADEALRVCFSVSRAWRKTLDSDPPHGLCLAVRQEYLSRAGSDYTAFERALESAVRYGGDKRKKTVAMSVAAGLATDDVIADLLYDYVDFRYEKTAF